MIRLLACGDDHRGPRDWSACPRPSLCPVIMSPPSPTHVHTDRPFHGEKSGHQRTLQRDDLDLAKAQERQPALDRERPV